MLVGHSYVGMVVTGAADPPATPDLYVAAFASRAHTGDRDITSSPRTIVQHVFLPEATAQLLLRYA